MFTSNEDPKTYQWSLLFNAQIGARYHMHQQRAYSRLGRFITASSLITGSSAFAVLFGSHVELAKWLAFAVAILQALELVIDTKGKVTLHNSLRQRYVQLELKLNQLTELTVDQLNQLKSERTTIEVDEPPVLKSLYLKCHNELADVYQFDEEDRPDMSGFQKFWAWLHS